MALHIILMMDFDTSSVMKFATFNTKYMWLLLLLFRI